MVFVSKKMNNWSWKLVCLTLKTNNTLKHLTNKTRALWEISYYAVFPCTLQGKFFRSLQKLWLVLAWTDIKTDRGTRDTFLWPLWERASSEHIMFSAGVSFPGQGYRPATAQLPPSYRLATRLPRWAWGLFALQGPLCWHSASLLCDPASHSKKKNMKIQIAFLWSTKKWRMSQSKVCRI